MPKYIHLKIRVTEEFRKALKIRAAKEGTTIQRILFQALNSYPVTAAGGLNKNPQKVK